MSNLGLRRALAAAGVEIVETPVGDRNVTTAMAEHDLAIGGEQSGHIVFADLATTGDGVLTGLIVGDLLARRGVPMSALAARDDAPAAGAGERAARTAASISTTRRGAGRGPARSRPSSATAAASMVRPSGTEPVVRVMVEAPTEAEAAVGRARDAGRPRSLILPGIDALFGRDRRGLPSPGRSKRSRATKEGRIHG